MSTTLQTTDTQLPTYDQVLASKVLLDSKFSIYSYGITKHYWSIYPISNRKLNLCRNPIFKYFSKTGHVASSLQLGKTNQKAAQIKRKTLKGEHPVYLIDDLLNESFASYTDIKLKLKPTPNLEFICIDNELHNIFIKVNSIGHFDLIKGEQVLGTFKRDFLVPFKLGEIHLVSNMSDQDTLLILIFVTFILYNHKVQEENKLMNDKISFSSMLFK